MKTLFKVLPMIAIVAALALSAFTSAKPVAKNKTFANYFWYPVNSLGQATQSTPVDNHSTALSKEDAMASLTDCNDTQPAECLRGSSSPSATVGAVIPLSGTDNQIRQN